MVRKRRSCFSAAAAGRRPLPRASAASREKYALPVATTFRRGSLFDQTHPCYAGDLGIGPNPKLLERIKTSDLVVMIGGRLGELPSQGYTLFDIPRPQLPFVHVHPGAEELGRVYSPQLAIHATPTAFAAALDELKFARVPSGDAKVAHADYLQWTDKATEQPGGVNFGAVMVWLRENLPADAILCNGAGNYAAWIHRFFRFRRFAHHVAPASGSMGYGVPAAVAMKRLYPKRQVVCLAGDGDFLMNGQEFATAVQYDLPFIIIIVDNGMYGTIRMHQEREYPGRISATQLRNPDFAAYARAFGGFGVSVARTEDFPAAFKEAQASGKPAIVRLAIDGEAITPTMTLCQNPRQSAGGEGRLKDRACIGGPAGGTKTGRRGLSLRKRRLNSNESNHRYCGSGTGDRHGGRASQRQRLHQRRDCRRCGGPRCRPPWLPRRGGRLRYRSPRSQ